MSAADDQPVPAILIEDDADLRDALVVTLRGLGLAVDGVGSVADFYRRLVERHYDLAIIDLGLPDGDGLSIVSFLAGRGHMGIIILSAAGAVEERVRGFSNGADLYFPKPVDCRELAAAAHRLVRRQKNRAIAAVTVTTTPECWMLRLTRWQLIAPGGNAMSLTPKEMQFMTALARQPGQVLRRSELLTELRYPDDVAGNRRLDAMIRRLRVKMEPLANGTLPITSVHGVGYSFANPILMDRSPTTGESAS